MQSHAVVTLWSRGGSWFKIQDEKVDSECPEDGEFYKTN